MNREIKFRAWDGEKMFLFDNHKYDLIYNDICGWNVIENLPIEKLKNKKWDAGQSGDNGENFVLMQLTGLKDKNGKEIYDGDIVKTPASISVVEFDKGLFGLNHDYGTENQSMLGSWGSQSKMLI